jgi:hypothetical protein
MVATRQLSIRITAFALILILGLFYVKWAPYYHKAFLAATDHAIGHSIITGEGNGAPAPSWSAALDYAMAYGKAIWQAMVLGLLVGSAVQTLVPPRWIAMVLGRAGFGTIATGCAMALPTMMCTCCAAPVVVGMRQANASVGGSVAFWLGNTLLNPATLVFMGFVLGWKWTALRLVAGLLMVVGLAALASRFVKEAEAVAVETEMAQVEEEEPTGSVFLRWLRHLGKMVVTLVPEYIVLVLLLGAARAWLFPVLPAGVGNDPAWLVGMAIAGTLFVIPTAGEIPIIQSMTALGLGAGPAAALLVTLPPVSLPSLWMVAKVFRPQVLLVLTAAVIACGVLTGALAIALGF